jgi:hypothetical protein
MYYPFYIEYKKLNEKLGLKLFDFLKKNKR